MSRRGDKSDELALGDTIGSDGALGVSDTVASKPSNQGSSLPPAAPQTPSDLPEIPRETYAVRRELARGGMGRILVADDARLGRRVAIKELITSNAGLAKRFAREVRITARLQHPAIVPVYEAGKWPDGEPFYAMKLIAGRSLEKVVDERHTLDDRLRLVPHLVQLAEAIAYAHGQGVVHRDLKPANVLIGDYGETVVIDWGLAKELDGAPEDDLEPGSTGAAELTVVGSVVGTPAYMAPEQARAEEVDQRADVYALGALMFHVLSGRPPYIGKKVDDLLAMIRTSSKAPRLVDLVPEVPEELAAIVAHAMAPDPAERYPSAKELAEELSRFQTGQLVAAHRYTRWQLAKRWLARHRAVIASLATLVVGAGVVGAIAVNKVVEQRDKARDSSLAALEEQGRRELVAQHPLRAAVYLAEAYRGGRTGEPLRLMLGQAMRAVDAAGGAWSSGASIGFLGWLSRDRLLAVADDGAVTLWDVSAGTRTPVAGDRIEPIALAVAAGGSGFAILGDGTVRIVDLAGGTSKVVKLGAQWAAGVAISPDGTTVALHGTFGIRLYGRDGTPRDLPGATAPVDEVTFAGDHELVATTEASVTRYDLTGATPPVVTATAGAAAGIACGARRFVDVPAGSTTIKTAAVSEGEHVATVDSSGEATWIVAGQIAHVDCGRDRAIVEVHDQLAEHGWSTPFRAVDPDATMRPLGLAEERAVLVGDTAGVRDEDGDITRYAATALDPQGHLFGAGTTTGSLRLWDAASGLPLATIDAHTRSVRGLAFDPTGARLASAGDDGVVRIWAVDQPWLAPAAATPPPVGLSARTPDGRVTVRARFNEVAAGDRILAGHEELVTWLAIDDGGESAVAGARDGKLLRWNLASGRVVGHWQQPSAITAGVLSGTRLATGGRDGTVRIWRNGDDPIVLGGHASAVHALGWRGSELLSAADAAVRVWAETGSLERYLTAGESVGAAWWTTQGLIVADGQSAAQIWDGDRGLLLAREPHGISLGELPSILGTVHGARPARDGLERLASGSFVTWPLPREGRDADAVAALVAARAPWRLVDSVLVPRDVLRAVRLDEASRIGARVYDFSGDTFELSPSVPAVPLRPATPELAAVDATLRRGDRAAATAVLTQIGTTPGPLDAYAAAWAWHRLREDSIAYDLMTRAASAWPEPATRERVRDDAVRFAAWAAVPHKKVLEALGATDDDRLRLALAQAYEDAGQPALVRPTLESISSATNWVLRLHALGLLARHAWFTGDLTAAVEHLEVAARIIPADRAATVTLGPKCTDVPLEAKTAGTDESEAITTIVTVTQAFAADGVRVFARMYDHRYALAARRLYALLADRYGASRERVAACNGELDAIAQSSFGKVGDFDKTLLRSEVKRNISGFETCYQRELDEDATVAGTVQTRIVLSTTGQLTSVEAYATPPTPPMERIATCVKDVMRRLNLARPMLGSRVAINYPFTFRPASR